MLEGFPLLIAMAAESDFTVLFVCCRNSARTIFGELLLRKRGRGRWTAENAGSCIRAGEIE